MRRRERRGERRNGRKRRKRMERKEGKNRMALPHVVLLVVRRSVFGGKGRMNERPLPSGDCRGCFFTRHMINEYTLPLSYTLLVM